MIPELRTEITIAQPLQGVRFDQAAVDLFPEYSRTQLNRWIRCGILRLNDQKSKPSCRLNEGQSIQLYKEDASSKLSVQQPIQKLYMLYEDQDILILNKSSDLVVHPSESHPSGTLYDALLSEYPELKAVPRAGIVHRLDKGTTGLMVIARTAQAQQHLIAQFKARTVIKIYEAIVHGQLRKQGVCLVPIGRDTEYRTRMAVVDTGKPASTFFFPKAACTELSYLKIRLHTGRTHQIRVHMAHQGYPLIGDFTYAARINQRFFEQPAVQSYQLLSVPALHAHILALVHPRTGRRLSWKLNAHAHFQRLLDYAQTCGLMPIDRNQHQAQRAVFNQDKPPAPID